MKTNSLKHTATKLSFNYDGIKADIIVKIRLNDECKNGHQDFAITADIYEAGRRGDRNYLAGGCCHNDIIEQFPEFKTFVDLHLCDYAGVPTYAVANGFYHMRTGFDNLKGKTQKEYFCDYYRVTPEQCDALFTSENELEFALLLQSTGVLDQWEKEAAAAILQLETLTGDTFVNDSKKSQYAGPTPEKVEEFKALQAAGHFTPEKKEKRRKESAAAAKAAKIKEFKEEAAKAIKKAQQERDLKIWFFQYVDRLSKRKLLVRKGFNIDCMFDNYIFYNHSNQIKFNWRGYGLNLTPEGFTIFCDNLKQSDFDKLPAGVTFAIEGGPTFAPETAKK